MSILLQFASLYDGQEVFMWPDCLLDHDIDFLVGNMSICKKAIQINDAMGATQACKQAHKQRVAVTVFICLMSSDFCCGEVSARLTLCVC